MPRKVDEPLDMWDYWRDKKGYEEALEFYYPNRIKESPYLAAALVQLKSAKLLIDQVMQEIPFG